MNLEDEGIHVDCSILSSAILRVDETGIGGCSAAVRKLLREGASVAQVESVVDEVARDNEAAPTPSGNVKRAVAFLRDELENSYYWDEFFALHG